MEALKETMDSQRKKQIRKKTREEFQMGRARLYRTEAEQQVRTEIAKDREALFAFFQQQGPTQQLELTESLRRLLLNFARLASYRGVLEGHRVFELGLELGEDRARYYLLEYLQENPDATNDDLVRYLDRKNGRLAALRTRNDDPLWAPLRPQWKREFEKRKIDYIAGEYWETAFEKLPKPVGEYLSRARKQAKEARVKNALFNWPRVIREHEKRRKS